MTRDEWYQARRLYRAQMSMNKCPVFTKIDQFEWEAWRRNFDLIYDNTDPRVRYSSHVHWHSVPLDISHGDRMLRKASMKCNMRYLPPGWPHPCRAAK